MASILCLDRYAGIATMNSTIAIVLLAAGSASRMGAVKQLLPWKETTLLENAIQQARASDAVEVVVVLGARAAQIKAGIATTDVPIIENEQWKSGMGSSISRGVDFLVNESGHIDGILVMLCDQPLIDSRYLNRMMSEFSKTDTGIIATAYEKRAGVPALFHKDFFSQLLRLNDEFGARELIAVNSGNCIALAAGNKVADIDTKKDYHALIRGIHKN